MEVRDDINITIYGKESCPWCVAAKEYMKGKKFTYIDLDERPDCVDALKSNGVHRIPAVFIDWEYIGGYEELKEFMEGD